jgi:hypothetical protein
LSQVRIQKEGEPLIDAYSALKKASKSKKCEKMVLIRTAKTEIDNFLNDDNLLLIDAHKMVIDNYFAT